MILSICDFTHHPLKSVFHYYSHTIPIQIPLPQSPTCHPSITLPATQAQNHDKDDKDTPCKYCQWAEKNQRQKDKERPLPQWHLPALHSLPQIAIITSWICSQTPCTSKIVDHYSVTTIPIQILPPPSTPHCPSWHWLPPRHRPTTQMSTTHRDLKINIVG